MHRGQICHLLLMPKCSKPRASGGFAPPPIPTDQGICPWTPLGACRHTIAFFKGGRIIAYPTTGRFPLSNIHCSLALNHAFSVSPSNLLAMVALCYGGLQSIRAVMCTRPSKSRLRPTPGRPWPEARRWDTCGSCVVLLVIWFRYIYVFRDWTFIFHTDHLHFCCNRYGFSVKEKVLGHMPQANWG